MLIYAITNQKGGVGKTTTAVNLAAVLAVTHKMRILLIDLDQQGHASLSIKRRQDRNTPIMQVIRDDEANIKDFIEKTEFGFDLLAGGEDVAIAEYSINSGKQSNDRLRVALRDVQDDYDVVLLDCPPDLDAMVSLALRAATNVLVPMTLEYLPADGLVKLDRSIKRARRDNPDVKVSGIFSIKSDEKTNLAKDIRASIIEKFGDVWLETRVRRNVKLAEAPAFGKTGFHYEEDAPGVEDFKLLANEMITRGVM